MSQYFLNDTQGDANAGQNGLKAIDALHIACVQAVESDYFITCDKRLINRCSGLKMRVVNPADFVLEISNDDPG